MPAVLLVSACSPGFAATVPTAPPALPNCEAVGTRPTLPSARTLVLAIDIAVDSDPPRRASYDPPSLLWRTAIDRSRDLINDFGFDAGDGFTGRYISSESHGTREVWSQIATLPAAPPRSLPQRPSAPTSPPNGLGNTDYDRDRDKYETDLGRWKAQVACIEAGRAKEQGDFTSAFINARLAEVRALDPRPTYGPTDVTSFFYEVEGVARAHPRQHVIAVLATDLNDRHVTDVRPDFHSFSVDVVVILYRRADPADERAARALWQQRLLEMGARRVVILGWSVSSREQICQVVRELPACP